MFPTTKSITDLTSALAHSKVQSLGQASGAGSTAFLRFDYKTGDFTFGRDQVEVTGEEIVVNTSSFAHGWILWYGGKPTKTMASFVQELPEPMPASPDGDQPTECRSFEARFEDDPSTVIAFESSSFGGRKGCDTLLDAVRIRSAGGESEFLFPVVRLDRENYKAKQGGTIHNPVFTVVDWCNDKGERQGNTPLLENEETAPVRRRRSS